MSSESRARLRRWIGPAVVAAVFGSALVMVAPTPPAEAIHDALDGCGQKGKPSFWTPDWDVLSGFDLLLLGPAVEEEYDFNTYQASCNLHDICYGTIGMTQQDCDGIMGWDFESACRHKYLPDGDWKSWLTPWRSVLYPTCILEIPVYWSAVRLGGGGSHKDAQQHARDFARCGPGRTAPGEPMISGMRLNMEEVKKTWGIGDNAGCSRIVDLSYGDGAGGTGLDCPPGCATPRWTAVFSTSSPYSSQGLTIDSSWEDIRSAYTAAWDSGQMITDLEAGDGKWAVVYSGGAGYTQQHVIFPTSQGELLKGIEGDLDRGFHVTDIEHGPGGWAAVASQGAGFTSQHVFFRDSWDEIVTELENAPADVEITEIEYGAGKWVGVLTGGTDLESALSWRTNFDEAHQSMPGKTVVDLEYGEGGYKYLWVEPRRNRPPLAVDDNGGVQSVEWGWTVWSEVTSNDSDPDGDSLSITGAPGCVSGCQYVVAGSMSAVSASRLEFQAAEGPPGGGDVVVVIQYTVSDGELSDTGRLTVTLRYPSSPATTSPSNQAPVAVQDSDGYESAFAGMVIRADVISNDFDPDGDPIWLTGAPVCWDGCDYVSPGSEVYSGSTDVEFAVDFDPSDVGLAVTITIRYTITDGGLNSHGFLVFDIDDLIP